MKKFLSLLLIPGAFVARAQTTPAEMAADRAKTGGVYYAYPEPSQAPTPAPKGFKPFYISHYGRHGSRYLISDRDYTGILSLMDKAAEAGTLTPLGLDLKARLDSLMPETGKRGGDLSPLGARQHRGIARRMAKAYPEVFAPGAEITAKSTLVPRCILSMANFCQELQGISPAIKVDMESSERNMHYMCHFNENSDDFNYRGWWPETYRKFRESKTNPSRLVASVFSDPVFTERYVNPSDFMWALYWIASDAQNTEGRIDFHDLFTDGELFDLWQVPNAEFYGKHSNYGPAAGMHLEDARNLLDNMIAGADAAIAGKGASADLRFGHDGNVVPLAALMHIEGCDAEVTDLDSLYKEWCNWRVSPMAANIQMVFFRNPKQPGKVLVKVLHNELEARIPVATGIWPYYDWADVRAYYTGSKPAAE